MKKAYLLFLLTIFVTFSYAQEKSSNDKKTITEIIFNEGNFLEGNYEYLSVKTRKNNTFSGSGFQIAYSRKVYKRFHLGVSWGKIYAKTDDNYEDLFWLDSETEIKKWEIGVAYLIINQKRFKVFGEVNYLGMFYDGLIESITDLEGNADYIVTGKSSDETFQLQVQGNIALYKDLFLTAKIGYGFGYNQYKSISLKTGLGYQF
ncbi:hypothetical protein [Mesonia sp. HuA40]|uniref:hypothetical protein n=1 Tax=Mesonia sp. HuA40 TaxID=2602761 RepID=UPI0011C9EA4E|nr:hypothetical protein [Mesonia sp. HuA40]TXK73670.1 hypothetical protein FT993_04985 [Mesonia sp. HuA40]